MKSANNWPKSDYNSMVEFYGPVGQNQVRLPIPYPMALAWAPDIKVNRITVHRKTAESLNHIFQTILYLYGREEIVRLGIDQWGGCLNVRKKRGGNSYSIHSWGAAHDFDPVRNGLSTPWHLANFSKPEYIDFFNTFIFEGWEPLGISWQRDAMHIQACDNDVMPLRTNKLLRAA